MPPIEKREFRPRIDITPDQAEFIKANCRKLRLKDFAEKFNVSISKVQTWKAELGIDGTRVEKNIKRSSERLEDNEPYFNWNAAKRLDFIINNC